MDAAPSLHFISNNYTFILTAQPTTSPYPRNHVTLPTEMRRYNLRIVALIHLVLSIVDFTFAGLAQSRAMYKSRAHSREDPVTEVEDTVSNPDDEKFFSDELKEALRETYYYVAVNTAVTTFASPSTFLSGLAPLHHGATTVGRDLIRRLFGVSQTLNEHPQEQEDLVSRSLANLRDENLRLLSILSRRILENLD